MSIEQQFIILGLNFNILRIIILFGWIRVVKNNEHLSLKINTIDKLIIYWVIYSVISYTLLYQSSGAFINRLGFAYNVLGLYFLFRVMVTDFYQLPSIIKIISLIIFPLACFMLFEYITEINIFRLLGLHSGPIMIRDGKIRCTGPFAHAITAGCFGAVLMPIFTGLWFKESEKKYALIGLLSSTVIVFVSKSSGPLLSYICGFIALFLWRYEKNVKIIRRAFFLSLIILDFYMKAPIWFLFARVSAIFGGHGYHRSAIIDSAVKYFNEWWLIGTKNTSHWMFSTLPSDPTMVDITNQYVSEGVKGGMGKLLLFIGIIYTAFKTIGIALSVSENFNLYERLIIWSIGVSLLVHVVNFFSVNYFDQMIVIWNLLLAMISTLPSLSSSASETKK